MNNRTTHGGKGDQPRISDFAKFQSNYDQIFKKKNDETTTKHSDSDNSKPSKRGLKTKRKD